MALGQAKLAITHGLSVWVLEAPDGFGDARVHSHHAIQITLSLSGALMLTGGDQLLRAPAIAVAADAGGLSQEKKDRVVEVLAENGYNITWNALR